MFWHRCQPTPINDDDDHDDDDDEDEDDDDDDDGDDDGEDDDNNGIQTFASQNCFPLRIILLLSLCWCFEIKQKWLGRR